jgi:predicted O-linked N-acetylglucosamine transferase (SPINDLY family)
MPWLPQAKAALVEKDYAQVISIYEQTITAEDDDPCLYWYMGLAYLLQGDEELAQTTWWYRISQSNQEQMLLTELAQVLDAEAKQQSIAESFQIAWLVRQHLRELCPQDINNLLHLIDLDCQLGTFGTESLTELQLDLVLKQVSLNSMDANLFLRVAEGTFAQLSPATLVFFNNFRDYIDSEKKASVLVNLAYGYKREDNKKILTELLEFFQSVVPNHLRILELLTYSYIGLKDYKKAIFTSENLLGKASTLPWKLRASYALITSLLSAGDWQKVKEAAITHRSIIAQIINEGISDQDFVDVDDQFRFLGLLTVVTSVLQYLDDRPAENHQMQTQINQLHEQLTQKFKPTLKQSKPTSIISSKPLRIGYIAHTFRQHSVGWLCRWLFQHHDRSLFERYLYFVDQDVNNDFSQTWFLSQADQARIFSLYANEAAEKIHEDQLDILVDLDSSTCHITSQILAYKPAPIQVTWLGYDASDLSTIDYFIADPYVLPEEAESYYSAKIWRLPQTYIAVEGFEVGAPSVSRRQLGLPMDAVVFFSSQTGYKRNPETIKLQLKILCQLPNSYLLIKGLADQDIVQALFTEIAEAEGVNPDRLRFLPQVSTEYIHRANLQIADVVLDTYPYNGATTTLEALWMGLPIVTRVGQQFAARNSYAFMINAGISAGIAHNDAEYVEWGVRLGADADLRRKIYWQLQQSRKNSPLWNAKQFTQDIETAYQQMWRIYNNL